MLLRFGTAPSRGGGSPHTNSKRIEVFPAHVRNKQTINTLICGHQRLRQENSQFNDSESHSVKTTDPNL